MSYPLIITSRFRRSQSRPWRCSFCGCCQFHLCRHSYRCVFRGQHLARRGEDQAVQFGARLPIEGIDRLICEGTGRRVTLTEDALYVPGNADQVRARALAFLKQMARDKLAAASDHYAKTLGKSYTRISIRDTRSRWGSCSSTGALMYSWRLILCPPSVLNYVAAHEVAHLAEMNHSQAFWDTVNRIHGPYATPRAWLRTNGSGLYAYQF